MSVHSQIAQSLGLFNSGWLGSLYYMVVINLSGTNMLAEVHAVAHQCEGAVLSRLLQGQGWSWQLPAQPALAEGQESPPLNVGMRFRRSVVLKTNFEGSDFNWKSVLFSLKKNKNNFFFPSCLGWLPTPRVQGMVEASLHLSPWCKGNEWNDFWFLTWGTKPVLMRIEGLSWCDTGTGSN